MIKLTYYIDDYAFERVCYNLPDLVAALVALINNHFTGHEVTPELVNGHLEVAIIKAVEVFNAELLSYSVNYYKIERITET